MPSKKTYRKRLQRLEQVRCLHELTFSCYKRLPLLTNDTWRQILSTCLQQACDDEAFDLVAFVFMPEHVHLLVLPISEEASIARLLARTKQPTSKAIKEMLIKSGATLLDSLTVRERPGKTCFRFWQEGAGYDRNLFSPQAIEASLDYLHANPVKRELCLRATDWKWSSARFHQEDIREPDLPRLTQLDPAWFSQATVTHYPT